MNEINMIYLKFEFFLTLLSVSNLLGHTLWQPAKYDNSYTKKIENYKKMRIV